MGCFNLTGGFTGLPIYYKNRCVSLICVVDSKTRYFQTLDPCSRGNIWLSPICPPARGEYNDYGYIMNIDKDSVSDMLEKTFGHESDVIMSAVAAGPMDKIYQEIMNILELDILNYELVLVIDHDSAYENVLKKHRFWNFDKSYDISYENRDFYEKHPDEASMKKYGGIYYSALFNVSGKNADKTKNMNPEIETGIFETYREPYPDMFLHLFKKFPQNMWNDGMKKHIVDFCNFWHGLNDMELNIDISRYGRQYRHDKFQIDFLEHCLEIIKCNEQNDDY